MILDWLLLIVYLILIPPLLLGTIRRTKAGLQNRIGVPIYQVFFDLAKLCRKGETLSKTLSWMFRTAFAMNFAFLVSLAIFLPWTVAKPHFAGVDLFYVVYVFAAARFLTLLAALDSGSAFGAFGASREVTLALMVEPASMLSLAALAVLNQTSDLTAIFAFGAHPSPTTTGIWLFSGVAIFLAGLVELSRMPIDDPTTHLELTMVHEAMILEASGRNLALIEYGHALKMTMVFGLVSQCLLHAIPAVYHLPEALRAVLSLAGIFLIAISLGFAETVMVKLRWRRNPDFIAYSLTMSMLACFVAIGRGILH